MELDDLKEAWTALDNRLKRNEELKESIILEMMQRKAEKLLNWLLKWNIIEILGMLIVIPFLVFFYQRLCWQISIFWDIFMIYAIFVCCITCVWYLFKLRKLMKIDLTTDFVNNINRVNQYNIYVKRERIILQTIVGPIFLVLMLLTYVDLKAQLHQWVLLVSVVAFVTIYGYWAYKTLYKKNIESIIKSLNEIKELKEE